MNFWTTVFMIIMLSGMFFIVATVHNPYLALWIIEEIKHRIGWYD